MKYFTQEGLTENQIKNLQLIDDEWIKRESDNDWEFISKSQIKTQKGFNKILWSHIKDLIPVQK